MTFPSADSRAATSASAAGGGAVELLGPLFRPAGTHLLWRLKLRAMWNHVGQVLAEAPLKLIATVSFITFIWFLLYNLFARVFEYFQTSLLQSAVAIPLVFHFFFVALLVLLTFSNALLAYGALFAHEEAGYLLSAPLRPLTTVVVKYGESLFFSSWSLLLLGLPLMMAIARVQNEAWVFYPLFVLSFLAFVPIPGAIGLVLAWFVARYVPHSARRLLVFAAVVTLFVTVAWGVQSVRRLNVVSDSWLDSFFARMSLIEASILPSTWVTRGIEAAVNDRVGDAVRYLAVTVANALFLSWASVRIVAHGFVEAYDRATAVRGHAGRPAASASGGWAGMFFFFLPLPARLIAAKDLRTFVRDPLQWSQLAILFGLMALYLANMPRFQVDDAGSRWVTVVPFLNLTAVSFILATFTSRFVFPMVSLEGHQLWLIGLLPFSRNWILVAKFAFAFTVTFSVACGVMLLASYILRIGTAATLTNLSVTAAVCFGLCGLAVGIGARLPMMQQRNPARIANGLGGTINLIASVLLISVMLAGMGYVTYRSGEEYDVTSARDFTQVVAAGVVSIGVGAGMAAMFLGARHLKRIEV